MPFDGITPHFRSRKRKHKGKGQLVGQEVKRGATLEKDAGKFFASMVNKVRFYKSHDLVSQAHNVAAMLERKDAAQFLKSRDSSRVLDQFLPYIAPACFEKLANLIASDYDGYVNNMYASFVIETMIKVCLHRNLTWFKKPADLADWPELSVRLAYNLKTKFDASHVDFCNRFLLGMAEYIQANADQVLGGEAFGIHVLRTTLHCLAGLDYAITWVDSKGVTSYNSDVKKINKICDTPKGWHSNLIEIVEALNKQPNFEKFPDSTNTSTVLQSMIKCLYTIGAHSHLEKYIDLFFGYTPQTKDERLAEIFGNNARLHFLENVLTVVAENSDLFRSLYTSLFAGRVKVLSVDNLTKFSVQKAIEHCYDKDLFNTAFDELIGCFDELLTSGNTNAIVELSKICRHRFVDKQQAFVEALQKALDCPDEQSMFWPLIMLMPYNQQADYSTKIDSVQTHGTQICQQLFFYPKTSDSFLAAIKSLKREVLLQIMLHKSATYIFHSLIENPLIGRDAQEWLLRRLSGYLAAIACGSNSNSTLECLYQAASPAYKVLIVHELSENLEELNSTRAGRIMGIKLKINAFANGVKTWNETNNIPQGVVDMDEDDEDE